jgi:hypothetical protein
MTASFRRRAGAEDVRTQRRQCRRLAAAPTRGLGRGRRQARTSPYPSLGNHDRPYAAIARLLEANQCREAEVRATEDAAAEDDVDEGARSVNRRKIRKRRCADVLVRPSCGACSSAGAEARKLWAEDIVVGRLAGAGRTRPAQAGATQCAELSGPQVWRGRWGLRVACRRECEPRSTRCPVPGRAGRSPLGSGSGVLRQRAAQCAHGACSSVSVSPSIVTLQYIWSRHATKRRTITRDAPVSASAPARTRPGHPPGCGRYRRPRGCDGVDWLRGATAGAAQLEHEALAGEGSTVPGGGPMAPLPDLPVLHGINYSDTAWPHA